MLRYSDKMQRGQVVILPVVRKERKTDADAAATDRFPATEQKPAVTVDHGSRDRLD